MKTDYSYAANDEIEVRVDLSQSALGIGYRFLRDRFDEEETWYPTIFQSADVQDEDDALLKVDSWLDAQGSN